MADGHAVSGNGLAATSDDAILEDGYPRSHLVRVIIQALHSLGLSESARTLERESHTALEDPISSQFKAAVIDGQWDEVSRLLPKLHIVDEEKIKKAEALCLQQKFLEMIHSGRSQEALFCLRNALAPLTLDPSHLRALTSLLVCGDVEDAKKIVRWDGDVKMARKKLLTDLRECVSASVLIPDDRLQTLLRQALLHQKQWCVYPHLFHNTMPVLVSLFEDHKCVKPISATTQAVLNHFHEVWFVAFSNSGKLLASASKDGLVRISDITDVTKCFTRFVLMGHEDSVSYVSWSPTDSHLLSCSADKTLRLWDMTTGKLQQTIRLHSDLVTGAAWMPDGQRFVSCGGDKKIYLMDMEGTPLKSWNVGRISEVRLTTDGSHIVATTKEKQIRFIQVDGQSGGSPLPVRLVEDQAIVSMSLSNDNKYILTCVCELQEIHLWDVERRAIACRFKGHRQSKYVLRPCFGGPGNCFVACGSEDNLVYLWHRDDGDLIDRLAGHSDTVNCVAWNPQHERQFATASDDYTVRIWAF